VSFLVIRRSEVKVVVGMMMPKLPCVMPVGVGWSSEEWWVWDAPRQTLGGLHWQRRWELKQEAGYNEMNLEESQQMEFVD
jgi:hypothetical protein